MLHLDGMDAKNACCQVSKAVMWAQSAIRDVDKRNLILYININLLSLTLSKSQTCIIK